MTPSWRIKRFLGMQSRHVQLFSSFKDIVHKHFVYNYKKGNYHKQLDILKSNEKILNEAKNYSDKNFYTSVKRTLKPIS